MEDYNGNIRVLIVEDEIITAMFLKQILEGLGCEILDIVSTGEKAVELARKSIPDVIFLDIILEGEMDGIVAAIEIHNYVNIPVVFTTGCSDESTINRALKTFPLGCIFKPYSKNELKNVLNTLYTTKECVSTGNA